jgi:hypothetical protein
LRDGRSDIDHGNPTSPQRMYNPHQRFVSGAEESQSNVAKLAVAPDQLGWTSHGRVCHYATILVQTHAKIHTITCVIKRVHVRIVTQ